MDSLGGGHKKLRLQDAGAESIPGQTEPNRSEAMEGFE
jgi:hypothetical protein